MVPYIIIITFLRFYFFSLICTDRWIQIECIECTWNQCTRVELYTNMNSSPPFLQSSDSSKKERLKAVRTLDRNNKSSGLSVMSEFTWSKISQVQLPVDDRKVERNERRVKFTVSLGAWLHTLNYNYSLLITYTLLVHDITLLCILWWVDEQQ